jgi:hypothetical protein
LEQQSRHDFMSKLIKSITTRKAVIDKLYIGLNLQSNIENDFFTNDIDCLLSKEYNIKLNFDHSVVISGALREGIT